MNDTSNLPEAAKIEVIRHEEMVDEAVRTIAQAAKTGYPGDGIITIENVEKMIRIRDINYNKFEFSL